jgi:hypothetical protein
MSQASPAGRSNLEQSKHSYWSTKAKLVVAGGVAASLSLAIGAVWFVKAKSSDRAETMTVSTVRPVETIRFAPIPEKSAKTTPTVPANVEPPQGTVRRMEAISGAFKK